MAASPTPAQLLAETSGVLPTTLLRPEIITWNLDVQHVIGENLTLDASYVGNTWVSSDRPGSVEPAGGSQCFECPAGLPERPEPNDTERPHQYAFRVEYCLSEGGDIVPAYAAVGVDGILTSYQPWGSSSYNGLSFQANYRYTNGCSLWARIHGVMTSITPPLMFSPLTQRRAAPRMRGSGPEPSESGARSPAAIHLRGSLQRSFLSEIR